jgi:hypothetical protein
MAYATINKDDKGGKKAGVGRGKRRGTTSSRVGGKRSRSSKK